MTDEPHAYGSTPIDSRDVNRALVKIVWATLKPLGFSARTQRSAWRSGPGVIQVVNFQSFNSYLADGLKSTTFSFSVNLGVFYQAIGDLSSVTRFLKDRSRPLEYHCHARYTLSKGIAQPQELIPPRWLDPLSGSSALGRWVDRPDIWLVLPDGSNLNLVATDARDRVVAAGIPWLERLSDLGEALRHFREVEDSWQGRGLVAEHYGGTLGSPSRLHSIGALSAALGDEASLEWAIDQMAIESYYIDHPENLELLRGAQRQHHTARRGANAQPR